MVLRGHLDEPQPLLWNTGHGTFWPARRGGTFPINVNTRIPTNATKRTNNEDEGKEPEGKRELATEERRWFSGVTHADALLEPGQLVFRFSAFRETFARPVILLSLSLFLSFCLATFFLALLRSLSGQTFASSCAAQWTTVLYALTRLRWSRIGTLVASARAPWQ